MRKRRIPPVLYFIFLSASSLLPRFLYSVVVYSAAESRVPRVAVCKRTRGSNAFRQRLHNIRPYATCPSHTYHRRHLPLRRGPSSSALGARASESEVGYTVRDDFYTGGGRSTGRPSRGRRGEISSFGRISRENERERDRIARETSGGSGGPELEVSGGQNGDAPRSCRAGLPAHDLNYRTPPLAPASTEERPDRVLSRTLCRLCALLVWSAAGRWAALG